MRPVGGVASFGRDGELHSPNPLRTRRNGTPASRLFRFCGAGIVTASEIAKLTAEAVSPEQIDTISNYLDDWENVSFEDKQQVVDLMITVIRATSEKLQIEWKI